jgi:hypothetical protein
VFDITYSVKRLSLINCSRSPVCRVLQFDKTFAKCYGGFGSDWLEHARVAHGRCKLIMGNEDEMHGPRRNSPGSRLLQARPAEYYLVSSGHVVHPVHLVLRYLHGLLVYIILGECPCVATVNKLTNYLIKC